MKSFSFFILIVLGHITAFAQFKQGGFVPDKNNVFWWRDAMCWSSGEFDTTKYSKEQILETFNFVYNFPSRLKSRFLFLPETPEQIDSLSIEELTHLHETQLLTIKNANLLDTAYFNIQKILIVNCLNESYETSLAIYTSFKKPEILNQFQKDDNCSHLINALIEGGDTLLAEWKQLCIQNCKNNTDSAWCFNENYTKKYDSPDRIKWARIALTNVLCPCIAQSRKYYWPYQEMKAKFISLFTNYKHGCHD